MNYTLAYSSLCYTPICSTHIHKFCRESKCFSSFYWIHKVHISLYAVYNNLFFNKTKKSTFGSISRKFGCMMCNL